jgi:hypothetical protein
MKVRSFHSSHSCPGKVVLCHAASGLAACASVHLEWLNHMPAVVIRLELSPHASAVLFVSLVAET